ncbi:putative S-adenosyl-L-methionine-dependent methyltransferase [Seiridium cardinale]
MESLAKASLDLIPPVSSGAVINDNDNGCGTGAATAAIVASMTGRSLDLEGTDINNSALDLYRKRAAAKSWPAEAIHADSNALTFDTDTFTLTIGNALLFVLANDGIDAVKEVYRTLKPGGLAVFNSWKYVPNMAPLEAAAKATRPEGIPPPRSGLDKWTRAEHLQDIIAQDGFDKAQVTMHQAKVHVTTSEIDRYVNMLWSFIGGTTPAGWLESDEENWDRALDIIKGELKTTEGYTEIEDGRLSLQFIANVAVAKKNTLQLAVEMCNVEVITLLINSGADVNGEPATDGGATALQGLIKIAMLLSYKGAEVSAAGAKYNGRTALEEAADWICQSQGHFALASELRKLGEWNEEEDKRLFHESLEDCGSPRDGEVRIVTENEDMCKLDPIYDGKEDGLEDWYADKEICWFSEG